MRYTGIVLFLLGLLAIVLPASGVNLSLIEAFGLFGRVVAWCALLVGAFLAVISFVPRHRTDPIFFLILGLISATYIILILAMLVGDAAYLAKADMRRRAYLDFEVYSGPERDEVPLPGTVIAEQFQDYGLTISANYQQEQRWPMILDSRKPPAGLEHLGSPHRDFDKEGPGIGAGGGQEALRKNQNVIRLRNVLVISDDPEKLRPSSAGGQFVFEWKDPVRVDEVQLFDVAANESAGPIEDPPDEPLDGSNRPAPRIPVVGSIVAYDRDGNIVHRKEVLGIGPNSVQSIPMLDHTAEPEEYESRVVRMEVNLPNSGAVARVEFTWEGHVIADWERESPLLSWLAYNPMTTALGKREIQNSIKLTLISCTISTILSLWVAIPIGYLLSRYRFWGRNFLDALLDIPIVLPPLVIGLSLLIVFKFLPSGLQSAVVYQVPAVVLAQFAVACAFAVRTMRATFDQIDARREQVALTLGCNRAQAFGMVVLPEAWRGILTAATLAWARSLGEFGPLLIFAGTTRNKTEVLSSSVFLEISAGDLGAAVAVSLIMVVVAVIVLMLARMWGTRTLTL